jgi:hypothetical protein
MMSDEDKLIPPTVASGDRLHAVVRGALGGIPVAGGLAAEVFGLFVVAPYQRRLQHWIETVSDQLRALAERQQLDLALLSSNDVFVSTLLQATQVAVRTHREEKLLLLRRAVLSAADDSPISADNQSTFVRYVDELTPAHFALLGLLLRSEDELRDCNSYQSLLMAFIEGSKINLSPDEFRLLCNDLSVRHLARFSSSMEDSTDAYRPSSIVMRGRQADEPMLRVTDIGRELIRFVGDLKSPNSAPPADVQGRR